MGFIAVLVSIAIIIALPRFKVNIALSIFIGAFFLIAVLGVDYKSLISSILSWFDFWRIIAIIFLSLLIVALMEKEGYLEGMVNAVKNMAGSVGLSMISISAFVGLLPMPGGAYVSARLVDPMTKELKLTSVESTSLNYWFRHLWEYSWPLYTGVILAAETFNKSIQDFVVHMFFLTVLAIIGGVLFVYLPIMHKKNIKTKKKRDAGEIRQLLFSSWPILAVMILTLALGLDLFYSLLMVDSVMLFHLLWKKKYADMKSSLKFAMRPTFLGVAVAALFMKFVVQNTGAIQYSYIFFNTTGVPPLVVIMLLPFLTGLMTGVTVAYVAVTFPLLLAYPMSYPAIALAYASGYAGHLTSPVHLCLVLSSKHFKADIYHVIKRILPAILFVVGGALIVYLFFG